MICPQALSFMMTSSKENIFRVTGPLCGEFTGHRWITLTKASDAELLMFSSICARTNGCVNIRNAGDLRCHRAHYDVIVMNDNPVNIRFRTGTLQFRFTFTLGHSDAMCGIYVGQHWLRYWFVVVTCRYQCSMAFSWEQLHSWKVLMNLIRDICSELILLKLIPHYQGLMS